MCKKVLSVVLTAGILFLAGCQATPDAPIVVNKNDGKLEEKIAETVADEQMVIEETEKEAAIRWTEEIETENGVTLDIDADVMIPDAMKFPVVRVKPRGFSDEEVRNAIEYLSNGATLYENTTFVQTKEQIEQTILSLKKELSEVENRDDFDAAQQAGSLKSQITYYESAYDSAPTEAEVARKSLSLAEVNSKSDVMFQGKNGFYATFRVDDERTDYNKCVLRYDNFNFDGAYTEQHYQETSAKGMQTSKQGALALAKKFLDGMGVKDFELSETLVGNKYLNNSSQWGEEQCYDFNFTRTVNGMATQYVQLTAWKTNAVSEGLSEGYRPPWTPEYISIQVDDSGVVSMDWFNPVEIVEVENDNVAVMNFDEVKKQFAKNMDTLLLGADVETLQLGTLRVKINKVVLGFQFLPVQNHYDEYRMTPCWLFMGNDNVFATGDFVNGPVSELGINAIDGSLL